MRTHTNTHVNRNKHIHTPHNQHMICLFAILTFDDLSHISVTILFYYNFTLMFVLVSYEVCLFYLIMEHVRQLCRKTVTKGILVQVPLNYNG